MRFDALKLNTVDIHQGMEISPDVSGVASTADGMHISFDVYKSKGDRKRIHGSCSVLHMTIVVTALEAFLCE